MATAAMCRAMRGILSGAATDLETTQAIADISGAVAFLQKPFRKNDLLAAVASALA